MTRLRMMALAGAEALVLGAAAVAAQAPSDTPRPQKGGGTPASWSYQIKDGKRVPKAERKVNADGSWTEETRSGTCTETRTGRNGEVRTTRSCD